MKNSLRLLWFLVLWFVLAPPLLTQEPEFRVITHPSNPTETLTRIEASRMFLKEVTDWKDTGETVLPVDQMQESPVRESFSSVVHRKKIKAIKAYWRQKIFSGRSSPPPEFRSDQDVLNYVKNTPGSIGYVSDSVSLAGVKVLQVE